MRLLNSLTTILLASSVLVGCGGGSSNGSRLASSAFSKATQSLETAGAAVSSAKIVQALGSQMGINAFDPHCTGLGTNADSTADYIGCILQSNDGSPETVLGAMNLVNEIISGIESRLALTYPTTPLTSGNITFNVTTADDTYTATVAVRESAGDGNPWTEILDVCLIDLRDSNGAQQSSTNISTCQSSGFSFTIQLRSTNDQLAFRFVNRFMGDYESVALMLDSTDDVMRFESWSFGNGNHSRGYIAGNVSNSLVLDNVSSVTFASANESGGNWNGVYGEYDGTDICMNHESSAPADNQYEVGDCNGIYPEYDSGFHNFAGAAAGFETWADDSSKGLLAFTPGAFGASSVFINQ